MTVIVAEPQRRSQSSMLYFASLFSVFFALLIIREDTRDHAAV